MRFNNAIIGIVLLAFGMAILWQVRTFPSLPLNNIGPATFPKVLSWVLIVASIILIVNGVREFKGGPVVQFDEWVLMAVRWRRMLLIPLVVMAFIFLSKPVGFIPTTFGLLLLMLYDYTSGRLLLSVIVSITFTGVSYMIFAYILLVPLPPGILINIIR